MANLVVCCDGTWNTPDDMDGGMPAPTNVRRLYYALAERTDAGVEQKKYYHPGVGTSGSWWRRILGGGGGLGLAKNVKSAYQWLAYNYRPGDQIFLFGFSRGAFTVRSLAGMIDCCGLLNISDPSLTADEVWRRIDLAFDFYRESGKGKKSNDAKQHRSRALALDRLKTFTFHNVPRGGDFQGSTKIFFLGVWDTVGALGVPNEFAFLNLLDRPKQFAFHNTTLCKTVENARHAVAIDERRRQFTPTLWPPSDLSEHVKQIWFPGVHSDVGGGYAQVGLSDGALRWMMDEAEAAPINLGFIKELKYQIKPDYLGVLHNSLTGFFKTLQAYPRAIPKLTDVCVEGGPFHPSVCKRYSNASILQGDYWPMIELVPGETTPPIDIYARDKWNATRIYLEPNATYRLTASGQWMDWWVKCGPEGAEDGRFHLLRLGYLAGSGICYLQMLWRRVFKNKQATFIFAKRELDMPWFSLVGMIANGGGADPDGDPVPHQSFLIGKDKTITVEPDKGGYLYCFANDAWGLYLNNKGHVALTVEKLS
jgi:hypothetical protein